MRVTYEGAKQAAEILIMHERVKKVLLFGSVAQIGEGRDLDIILVTDEDVFDEFKNEVLEGICFRGLDSYHFRSLRLNAAKQALGFDSSMLFYRASRFGKLDVFIFPENWTQTKQLEYLQTVFPHRDPYFMQNLVREAVRIA